jgi:hypothetical protein
VLRSQDRKEAICQMTLSRTAQQWTYGVLMSFGLVLTGCGSDAETASSSPDAGAVASDPESAVDDLAEGLEDAQDAVGGGSATLTVGGKEYTFEKVLCAIGTEATGNDDFEFSLSAIEDGMQLSVDTGPTYGDHTSLNDIEDFENPKVGWESEGNAFLTIQGNDVSGTTKFRDSTDDLGGKSVSGEIVATCP